MNAPVSRDQQSPLEAALLDVQATLAALLAAADEQYVALVEHDRHRLESVTRLQERLSARLERAERKRLEVLGDRPVGAALAAEAPHAAGLASTIGDVVLQLQSKHALTASLIEKSVELNNQTIQFLQHLVGAATTPAYGGRGASAPRHSVLLDSRA